MGSFVSKNDEDDFSTPDFERYGYSKSLDEDPRSPAADDVTRTPIISYDKVNDPRSPSQYERTPVFAIPEPSTPEIRYMLDNLGFEDSPLSTASDSLPLRNSIPLKVKDKKNELQTENFTPEAHSDFSDENDISSRTGDNAPSPLSALNTGSDMSPLIKDQNVKKLRNRRSSNKKKNSLLKQALFKPYVDSNETSEQINIHIDGKQQESKRKPLGSRNDTVLENLNISNPNNKENIPVKEPTKRMHSDLADKENALVY